MDQTNAMNTNVQGTLCNPHS